MIMAEFNHIVTGQYAIDIANENSLTLNKFADNIEGPRRAIGVEEALNLIDEDPSLVWVDTMEHD